MTVIVSKPAVNLREELASLRNQGGYQEQQFYFDSLVTNGTFDANITGWTNASAGGASISWNASGYLQLNPVSPNRGDARATIQTKVGVTYQLLATDEGSSVNWQVSLATFVGGNNILSGAANTSDKSVLFVARSSTTHITLTSGFSTGTSLIDNISVFETDGTDVVHRMPKGWVPKDVFEDGLLQREGSANDYEVVYDGFDYYVKPVVAPSATTQTCVIGVKA